MRVHGILHRALAGRQSGRSGNRQVFKDPSSEGDADQPSSQARLDNWHVSGTALTELQWCGWDRPRGMSGGNRSPMRESIRFIVRPVSFPRKALTGACEVTCAALRRSIVRCSVELTRQRLEREV